MDTREKHLLEHLLDKLWNKVNKLRLKVISHRIRSAAYHYTYCVIVVIITIQSAMFSVNVIATTAICPSTQHMFPCHAHKLALVPKLSKLRWKGFGISSCS